MRHFIRLAVGVCLFLVPNLIAASNDAHEIHVTAGEAIQKAIDSAPAGAVIRIDAGTFDEHLRITKAVTIVGAGWEKTTLKPAEKVTAHTDAERIALANRLENARDPRDQMRIVGEYLNRSAAATITASTCESLTLRDLKIQGIAPSDKSGSGSEAIIRLDHSHLQMGDCAVVGPCQDGVVLTAGSEAEIRRCLIAAVWSTGVAVSGGQLGSKVHLSDCDVRNCYYAGVTLGGEGSVIEDCRISGSAWHGIRYDNCSPTITGNVISGNARSGIYASGDTHAIVRNNMLWKNEMDGMSCWFDNADTVERNTIVENLREGILVAGDAAPKLLGNIFATSPVGVDEGQVANKGGDPHPSLVRNFFWRTEIDVRRLTKTEPLPTDNVQADPMFVDPGKHNYATSPNSPAAGAGSTVVLRESPWPLQPEEKAMIPKEDTRDSTKWNKPAGMR
jgi:hypothetical protein